MADILTIFLEKNIDVLILMKSNIREEIVL